MYILNITVVYCSLKIFRMIFLGFIQIRVFIKFTYVCISEVSGKPKEVDKHPSATNCDFFMSADRHIAFLFYYSLDCKCPMDAYACMPNVVY